MELLEEHRCFEGRQQRWRHDSTSLNCAMTFSIFLPPTENPPVLFWLSGLTCNDENFTTKAGAQRIAAELGIALVMPDTSPRSDDVADDAGYDPAKAPDSISMRPSNPGRATTACMITFAMNFLRWCSRSLWLASAARSAATQWADTGRSSWR